MAGIYSLSYANKYPEEVLGFIWLDNTIKNLELPRDWKALFFEELASIFYKLRLFRLVTENYKNQYIALDSIYHYADEEKNKFWYYLPLYFPQS